MWVELKAMVLDEDTYEVIIRERGEEICGWILEYSIK